VLDVHLCPSEPRNSYWNQNPGPPPDPYPSADADYGGMFGPRSLGSTLTNDPPAGMMIFNQCVSLAQITDGSSLTIAGGEDPEAINAMWICSHNTFDQSAAINARPPFEYGEESKPAPGRLQHPLCRRLGPLPEKLNERCLARRAAHARNGRSALV
jgi:hypothetical protein